MSKELITVVTVCFNAGQTIAKTMQSVLNQTYRPLEYILVDGKSTDNTLNIIYELEPLFHEKGIAVRIVSEKDKGIFDAMNKGVKLANVHIPADTRSAFPVISVQSPVSIQCCWQS